MNALASRPGRSRFAACVRRFATRGWVREGLPGWASGAALPSPWRPVAEVPPDCLSAHRETSLSESLWFTVPKAEIHKLTGNRGASGGIGTARRPQDAEVSGAESGVSTGGSPDDITARASVATKEPNSPAKESEELGFGAERPMATRASDRTL